MRSTLAVAAIAIGLLSARAEAQMPSPVNTGYNFSIVTAPGLPGLTITALNDVGDVAGVFQNQDGSGRGIFVERAGKLTTYNNFGFAIVLSINNKGVAIGTSGNGDSETPFIIGGGAFPTGFEVAEIPLRPVGKLINNQGQIIGTRVFGTAPPFTFQGFVYQILSGLVTPLQIPGGILTVPMSINDRGDIVGNGNPGFLYHNGQFTTVDPATSVPADEKKVVDLNNMDTVIGNYSGHAFIYQAGQYKSFDVPGAMRTSVVGINDAGTIVGTWLDNTFVRHGYVYQNGTITTLDVPGGLGNTNIGGINNKGVIFGNFSGGSFLATPGQSGSVNVVTLGQ